jgi:PhnB protein
MSQINLKPYLFFTGNCKEAMEFYKSVFGGDLTIQMMDDAPVEDAAKMTGKVMHASLVSDNISFMASDGSRTEPYEMSCITLSLDGSNAEKLTEMFNALAEGGKVTSPLKKEYWGATFGMLTDKFGIDWMVNIGE